MLILTLRCKDRTFKINVVCFAGQIYEMDRILYKKVTFMGFERHYAFFFAAKCARLDIFCYFCIAKTPFIIN